MRAVSRCAGRAYPRTVRHYGLHVQPLSSPGPQTVRVDDAVHILSAPELPLIGKQVREAEAN
jgi:hypothetical protein